MNTWITELLRDGYSFKFEPVKGSAGIVLLVMSKGDESVTTDTLIENLDNCQYMDLVFENLEKKFKELHDHKKHHPKGLLWTYTDREPIGIVDEVSDGVVYAHHNKLHN